MFVPNWVNTFVIGSNASRGKYPIGVRLNRYVAQCSHPLGYKSHPKRGPRKLGHFKIPEEAHAAWLAYKLSIALELRQEMDDIDSRLYDTVVRKIKSMK